MGWGENWRSRDDGVATNNLTYNKDEGCYLALIHHRMEDLIEKTNKIELMRKNRERKY